MTKQKRKSKNQSYNKRFVLIIAILLLTLILSVSIVFFYLSVPCCTAAYQTSTPFLTSAAVARQIAASETLAAKIIATMTAEAP